MKRLFWTLSTPVVYAGYRLGVWSYLWVNVCRGAREPSSFNPLWQNQWYGTPINRLPEEVILCGIGYRTSVSEGTVVFINEVTRTRIVFERDPFDRLENLWHVMVNGQMPASHVRDAYSWVCAVFGASFVKRTCSAVSYQVEGK